MLPVQQTETADGLRKQHVESLSWCQRDRRNSHAKYRK